MTSLRAPSVSKDPMRSRLLPTRLTFAKGEDENANSLVSDKKIPEGEHIDIVLQIKTAPDAKSVTERITLHLHAGH